MTLRVVITGINGALGQALARIYQREGYSVFGIDQQPESKTSFAYHSCDLSKFCDNSQAQANLMKAIDSWKGSNPLNVLINNAAYQWVGSMQSITDADFIRSFQVNVFAPFSLIKLLADDLKKSHGSVVNIGSIHARLTKKHFQAYSTSKASLSALTRSLALEYGQSLRINCIEPAAIDTPMLQDGFKNNPELLEELKSFHPQQRIATPDEIAELALFVSRSVQFLHGSCIDVSGGISCALHDPG
jgi:NAD(P)-dependent dehydrogenase (short-subunit alcohol dehydrogenase family)